MSKCLYMVCPTDLLEPILDLSSDELNYFYSSLGNNLALDKKIFEEISLTIEKEGIIEIIFAISENNRIVLDALSNQNLKNLRGINSSYNKLLFLKKQTIGFWGNDHNNILYISYFINEKISQLKSGLGQHLKNLPIIKGKNFSSREKNTYKKIPLQQLFIPRIRLNI